VFSRIIDLEVCDIVNGYPEIKSIQFHKRPNITHKTIDELIKLTLK